MKIKDSRRRMRDEREMMSKGEIMECIVKKGKDIR